MADLHLINDICDLAGPALGSVMDRYIEQSLDGAGFDLDDARTGELNEALAQAIATALLGSQRPVLELLNIALVVQRLGADPSSAEGVQEAVRNAALRHSKLVSAQLYSVAPAGAA